MKKLIAFALASLLSATAIAATPVQRISAIADALIDGTATNEQKLRVADAFVEHFRSEIISSGLDPDNLTNDQKARVVIRALKDYVREVVRIQDAVVQTAKDDLSAAQATADSTASGEWPEE